MKPIHFVFLSLFSPCLVAGQDTITSSQAAAYLNKEVILVGRAVHQKHYWPYSEKSVYFIDIDARYPANAVTVVLFQSAIDRCGIERFEAIPRNAVLHVCGLVTAKASSYEGEEYLKYQIVVTDCGQVEE